MALVETFDDFFNASEFAVNASFNGQSFNVIFDNAYAEGLGMAGTNPFITAKASDLGGAVAGELITVNGINYTVANPPASDGTGLVILQLEKA
ncbi:MAG: hypothetical protein WBC07_08525 [Methylotenera sp.]